MIRLRTFGATDLRGADGSEVSRVLAQPKRFALLAYLAAAHPAGVHRRDRVLALFWPELSDARARDALNQALHYLRRALGAEVIVRRSPEDVGVDPELLWCDAAEFRAACEAGRWDEALALYEGDFLEGLFVEGADGFERWMEDERSALRELAAKGARELARQNEGADALTMAIDWGRRALEIAPTDERALRQVLRLHIRAGDHAGALRLYDDFARRLAEQWDLAPSPETQAVIADLRADNVSEPRGLDPPGSRATPDRDPAPARSADAMAPDTDASSDARVLAGRYRLERELGSGASATVHLARDLKQDRRVAVKVLSPSLTNGLARDRFLREIRVAGRLQHPGIVPLFDSGESEGRLFYVMPVVQGETLRRRLRRGPMAVGHAVRVLRDVAESLQYAHGQGIIHRDIKPENVLMVGRRAVVADFGIARAAEAARPVGGPDPMRLTQVGTSLGTPTYASPEQAAGAPDITYRTDLYSLGVLGYETLAGRPPFVGDTPQQILAQKLTEPAPDLAGFRPDAPDWLVDLVMHCLAREPDERPETAEMVVDAIRHEKALRDGSSSDRVTTGWWRQFGGRRSVRRVSAWGGIAFVAAVSIALGARERASTAAPDLDRDLVAVLPFRIAGDSDVMVEMREGVVDLSAIYLSGEQGGLRTVEPATLFRAWHARAGPDAAEDLDDGEALALARELGAGWLMRGSFVGTGDDVLLRASLIPVGQGDVLQASVTGAADSLLAHVPLLLGRVVAQRGGIPADQSRSLNTNSLDAVRAYLVGQRHYRRGEYGLAVDRFAEALVTDSAFALAGLGLLMAHEWSGSASPELTEAATRSAWENRDRLRSKDRALVEAVVGPAGPEFVPLAEVQAARERAAEEAPDRFEAWYLLADHLYHVGALLGLDRPLERAEQAFRRSLEIDPSQAGVLHHLIEIAAWRGDTAAVRDLWDDYGQLVPDPAARFRDEWLVGHLLGDTALVARAFEHFDGSDAAFVGLQSLLFSVAFYPHLIDPLRELGAITASGPARVQNLEQLAVTRRWLALDAGRPREAADLVAVGGRAVFPHHLVHEALFWGALAWDESASLGGAADELVVCAEGTRAAGQGRWSEVAEAVTRLQRGAPSMENPLERLQAEGCRQILEAWHAQGTGHPDARRIVVAVDSVYRSGPYLEVFWENLALARLLEAEGELARASAAAGRFRYGLGYPHYMATILREGGRLAALAGDRPTAIDRYTRYLALRGDPEPEVAPEVEEVRAALQRLVASNE